MKILTLLLVSLMFISVCDAENILLSAATTDKELVLANIEYANKKFKIVDYAIFKLPFQAGVTAVRRLQDGNYQVAWTAQDASKKIKLHRIIVDSNLNKVKNTKKFARVLASYFNLNLVNPNQQALKAADTESPFITYSRNVSTVVAEASGPLGDLRGEPDPLFTPLPGVTPIDTAIANSSNPTAGNYYGILGNAANQYVLILGNTSNPVHTAAYAFTGGDVTSIDLVPETGTDNFSLYGWEKLNNPVRYRIFETIFDGVTGRSVRQHRTLWITKPGDLGAIASFNPLAVLQSSQDQSRRLRFAFFTAEEPGLAGTNLYVSALTDEDKKKIALYLNFDFVGSPNNFYGLDATNLESDPPMPDP